MGLPETSVFNAQLSTGIIRVGAYDYDKDEFEKQLDDKESMESDQKEMESLLLENQVKNTDPDRQESEEEKQNNLKEAGQSKDDYNVVFEV